MAIVLTVFPTVLEVTRGEHVLSGGVRANEVEFRLLPDDPTWQDMALVGCFQTDLGTWGVLLDEDNRCTIPWEALEAGSAGSSLEIGLYGVGEDDRDVIVRSTVWARTPFRVLPGADARPAKSPTPDQYQQMLSQAARVARRAEELEKTGAGVAAAAARVEQLTAEAAENAAAARNGAAAARTSARAAEESAESAGGAVRAVREMKASAHTLESGSPATAETALEDGVMCLSLGIPQGPPGPEGPRGPAGGGDFYADGRTPMTGTLVAGNGVLLPGQAETEEETPADAELLSFFGRGLGVRVDGLWALAVTADGLDARDRRVRGVAAPASEKDAANRAYVDGFASLRRAVVLSAGGWSAERTQTAAVEGVLEGQRAQVILAEPSYENESAWHAAGIRRTGQGSGTVTFTADTVPEGDLTAYVTVQAARS